MSFFKKKEEKPTETPSQPGQLEEIKKQVTQEKIQEKTDKLQPFGVHTYACSECNNPSVFLIHVNKKFGLLCTSCGIIEPLEEAIKELGISIEIEKAIQKFDK